MDECALSDSSITCGANNSSSNAAIYTEGLVDLNLRAHMPQTIPEDNESFKINTEEISFQKTEIIFKEIDESKEFNNVIGHENRICWLERRVILSFIYKIAKLRCMSNLS